MVLFTLEAHPRISTFRYWQDATRPISREPDAVRQDPEKNYHHQAWLKFLASEPKSKTHLCTWTHWVPPAWVRYYTPIRPPEKYWAMLRQHHDCGVVIRRRNVLRQYLSREIAKLLDRFSTREPCAYDPAPIELPLGTRFAQFVRKYRHGDQLLQATFGSRCLFLDYEDLVADWAGAFRRLQEFVGVEVHNLKPPTCKQETRTIAESVTNYEAIQRFLRHHGWEHWLDD